MSEAAEKQENPLPPEQEQELEGFHEVVALVEEIDAAEPVTLNVPAEPNAEILSLDPIPKELEYAALRKDATAGSAARALGYELTADGKIIVDAFTTFSPEFITPLLKLTPIISALAWDCIASMIEAYHIRLGKYYYEKTSDLRVLDLLGLELEGNSKTPVPTLDNKERSLLRKEVRAPANLGAQVKKFFAANDRKELAETSEKLRKLTAEDIRNAASDTLINSAKVVTKIASKVTGDIAGLYALPKNLVSSAFLMAVQGTNIGMRGVNVSAAVLGQDKVFKSYLRSPFHHKSTEGMEKVVEQDNIPTAEIESAARRRDKKRLTSLGIRSTANAIGTGFQTWFIADVTEMTLKYAHHLETGNALAYAATTILSAAALNHLCKEHLSMDFVRHSQLAEETMAYYRRREDAAQTAEAPQDLQPQ